MGREERYSRILDWFEINQPMPATELHYDSPFHLLIAVILSAQCTDKRVNAVVPPLFERFPKPEDLASATFEEVYPFIKSVSYPNSKTAHLIAMAGKLVSDYDPKTECAMYADAERPERIELDPQRYCILFPGQMHKPGMTLDKTNRIVKVVVKVPYSE